MRIGSKGKPNQAVVLLPRLTLRVLLLALRQQRALLQSPSSGSDKQNHIHPALKREEKKGKKKLDRALLFNFKNSGGFLMIFDKSYIMLRTRISPNNQTRICGNGGAPVVVYKS